MRITLRQASAGDFDYCASVYIEGMEQTMRALGMTMEGQPASLRQQWVAAEVWMILADGRAAGWLQRRDENDALFLGQFFVEARFRGQGIGSRVLAGLIEEAEASGRAVTLGVVRTNPARRLYERFGFEVTHEDERKFYMRRAAGSEAPAPGRRNEIGEPMPRQPAECQSMDEVRAEIDRIDSALVDLVAERFGYVERAWQLKSRPEEATVPWRIQQVIDRVRVKAKDRGLPPELAEALWRQMIGWFIQYEEEKLQARGSGEKA